MRLRLRPAAILFATLLAGCGGVFSKNPASDDETTKPDDGLVGFWRIDRAASKLDGDGDDGVLVVGRKKGSERDLELLLVSLKGEQKTIAEIRTPLRTTSFGQPTARSYASVADAKEEGKPEVTTSWVVVRYETPDADTLRILAMDEKAVGADVKAGAVEGSAPEPKEGGRDVTVTLTATTTALRAYLEKRGDAIWKADAPLVLRRLRLR